MPKGVKKRWDHYLLICSSQQSAECEAPWAVGHFAYGVFGSRGQLIQCIGISTHGYLDVLYCHERKERRIAK